MVLLPTKFAAPVARLSFIAVVGLSAFLLVARYKLALPDDHPYGGPASIGKQEWAVSFKAGGRKTTATSEAVKGNSSTTEGSMYSDDWADEDEEDLWGSLPFAQEIWDPLNPDTTPITEITIKSCVLPPGIYDLCSPTSDKKEDATRGVWQRVDRDINKKAGIYYLYVFYRRLLPGSDAPIVTNVTLLDHSPTSSDLPAGPGIWVEVSESIRTGTWPRMDPLFLHYHVAPQKDIAAARKMSSNKNAGALEPITEFDIIYGGAESKPLYGYEKVRQMITGGLDDEMGSWKEEKKPRVGASLAYRKTIPTLPKTPTLRFSAAGNFTILQVADLHFSVGPGACRDMDSHSEAACKKAGADAYSLAWLELALKETKPDLVVLSGDQLNGQDTSWSAQSTIMKWAPILYNAKIPWTTVFGNHDDEKTDMSHDEQINLMKTLPYYLGEIGPTNVDGSGNYVRSIRAADGDTVLTTLYFLDSHAYAKSLTPWGDKGYDSIKASQINWFRGRSSQVKTYSRPYVPSTSKTSSSNARPGTGGWGRRMKRQLEEDEPQTVDDIIKAVENDEEADPGAVEAFEEFVEEMKEEEAEEEALETEEAGTTTTRPKPKPLTAAEKVQEAAAEDVEEKIEEGDELEDEGGAAGMGAAVVPNEGENVVDEIKEGETNPLLAEESGLTPTKLASGPTKKKPLVGKPNAMVFFHIPLVEAYDSPIDVGADGKRLIIGDRFEGSGASKTNSGFFEEALLAQDELVASKSDGPVDEFWDGEFTMPTEGRPEVKVVATGHCHITEDCRRVKGVWLCFGGGGSYSGYGKIGFARRMRVYQLSEYGERIETYKLLDNKQRIDRVVLVGEDAMGV